MNDGSSANHSHEVAEHYILFPRPVELTWESHLWPSICPEEWRPGKLQMSPAGRSRAIAPMPCGFEHLCVTPEAHRASLGPDWFVGR